MIISLKNFKTTITRMGKIMSEVQRIKSKKSWNKTDLTVLLANEAHIPKVRAAHYINILTETIAEALEGGKKVTISDFGTFQVSERRSFDGRNPKTGDPLTVPVRRIPVFRAGKKLKFSLNTPQIKECGLVGANKIRLRFSKLMNAESDLLTDPKSYSVSLDQNLIGSIVSVSILETEDETRTVSGAEVTVSGVRSVVLECPKALRGSSMEIHFKNAIPDIDGNVVALD